MFAAENKYEVSNTDFSKSLILESIYEQVEESFLNREAFVNQELSKTVVMHTTVDCSCS